MATSQDMELQQVAQSPGLAVLKAHKPFSTQLIQSLTENKMKDLAMDVREKYMPGNVPSFQLIVETGTAMPALRELFGFRNTVKIVSVLIGNLCGAFNVSKNMSPDQIADYAMEIVETSMQGSHEEPTLRLEDFAVFIQLAKAGKFGKPFDYVDAALIESWLDQYYAARMRELHAEHERRKDANAKDSVISRKIDWEQDPDKKLERRLNEMGGKFNSMKDKTRRANEK